MELKSKKENSSFRDPSGFVFYHDGITYRLITELYKNHYEQLISSKLFQELVDNKLLVNHSEVNEIGLDIEEQYKPYKIIKPEKIDFVSYPYEWCFSQLKDAALLTLQIQKTALRHEMSLKDCSAYNVQFRMGKPIFIDTLSFEKYIEGKPWIPYRQFCQHFLAPLYLMSYKDVRLNHLSKIFIDGIPLDLASSLLPLKTFFKFHCMIHIHFHAKAQQYLSDIQFSTDRQKISLTSLNGLIDSLESAIKKIKLAPKSTIWSNYYNNISYSNEELSHKSETVTKFLEIINPKLVWDIGSNTGMFSRIASLKNCMVISFDFDHTAVENNYLNCVKESERNILPLVMDMTNPSPSIGWQNEERASLINRGPAEVVFALALLHHLVISNNVSFKYLSNFFHKLCNWLIIEFIPANDLQVHKLMSTSERNHHNYNQQLFENEFARYFKFVDKVEILNSGRIIYLMKKGCK